MTQNKKSQKNENSNLSQFNKYLDNNLDVLGQKFKQYFEQPFPLKELNNQDQLEFALKYIYDIFNFSKYQANPSLNKTLKTSLIDNIQAFIKQQTTTKQTFNNELAVKLLRFCIQHNQMFAVHYDKKKAPQKAKEQAQNTQVKPEQVKSVQNKRESQIIQSQQQVSRIKQEQIEPSSPLRQKSKSVQRKRQQLQQKSSFEQITQNNQFQESRRLLKQENTQLIKKQLKGVFQYYCKQQQSLAPNSTFDNINHKCQTMNLGKFMTFAITVNIIHSKDKIYSEGKLDKMTVVGIFKKFAQGFRDIGFPTFVKIMEELKKIDPELYYKLGLGEEGIKGRNKLHQKLKSVNLPFSTRDLEGRESLQNKIFVSKLTAHSGKNEDALRDQLLSRKNRGKLDFKQRGNTSRRSSLNGYQMQKEDEEKQEKTKFSFKLGQSNDNLQNQDLKFLSKLITQEQNDEVFLKDYRLPSKRGENIGKNINKSFDQSRYRQQAQTGIPFISPGTNTAKHSKKEDFVLPSIAKRGRITEVTNQRRSLGTVRRIGQKTLLSK